VAPCVWFQCRYVNIKNIENIFLIFVKERRKEKKEKKEGGKEGERGGKRKKEGEKENKSSRKNAFISRIIQNFLPPPSCPPAGGGEAEFHEVELCTLQHSDLWRLEYTLGYNARECRITS
jgi:hypothetical protein